MGTTVERSRTENGLIASRHSQSDSLWECFCHLLSRTSRNVPLSVQNSSKSRTTSTEGNSCTSTRACNEIVFTIKAVADISVIIQRSNRSRAESILIVTAKQHNKVQTTCISTGGFRCSSSRIGFRACESSSSSEYR